MHRTQTSVVLLATFYIQNLYTGAFVCEWLFSTVAHCYFFPVVFYCLTDVKQVVTLV